LKINTLNDLLLFIPDPLNIAVESENSESYISYILCDKYYSIIHCVRLKNKQSQAFVVESKRTADNDISENEFEVSTVEYRDMLYEKLSEVYNAVSS
jgi:hypothetical protein